MAVGFRCSMPFLPGFLLRVRSTRSRALLAGFCWVIGVGAGAGFTVPASGAQSLSLTPPMGWNDWAHYQCGFTAQTILDNAKLLVNTGLAARGYNTVTIDDCWMQKVARCSRQFAGRSGTVSARNEAAGRRHPCPGPEIRHLRGRRL